MHSDPDCIFCKIIAGDIPSHKVFEDEMTFAFMDINPARPGHTLVVPKHHSADLYETPEKWLTATVVTAQKVARAVKEVVRPHGLNLLQANGAGAAQSVFHLHVHVLPRGHEDGLKMNWGLHPGDADEVAALAGKIRAELG
jgi:histidine triad (HIT) family protein